jgi:DNA-binding transcriptional LysR family regulator
MADTSGPLRSVSLRQLRVFAIVARRLNFTAAARELHLTQPAVSMQVRELEASCGLALFEKVGRRLQLTEAGEELARCASGIDEQLRQTRERLDALAGLDRGLLQLGAVSTAKYFAPSLLAAFRQRHPGVTIRFSVGNRDDVIRQLAGSETDLVIMGRPPRELETVAEKFARHPFGIIAPPTHPLADRRRIDLKRLASESFMIREPGSGTRATMEHAFRERGATYQATMEVSSNETIKQAVMAGMGISFISLHTVGLELAAGKLVRLNVVGLPVVRDWWVMHLASRRLAPMAAAFRRFLLEQGAGIIAGAVGETDRGPVVTGV